MKDLIPLPPLMPGHRKPSHSRFEGGEQAIVMTRRASFWTPLNGSALPVRSNLLTSVLTLSPCRRRRAAICAIETVESVESECGAVALGQACLFPPLSSGGALVARPWLRFHTPLIEPDVRIARIRLSDKTSRLRPRHVVSKPAQTYEPEVPVEVREDSSRPFVA